MERIRLRQENVCLLCEGTAGDERRHLAVFHALVYFVHLCDTSFCNSYCAIMFYYGSYCCNYIWMPPPGYILDYIITSLYVKKIMQFQSYLIRRYGPVPTIFWVASENSLGKSFLGKYGAPLKNEG